MSELSKICPRCKKWVSSEKDFCETCGTKLIATSYTEDHFSSLNVEEQNASIDKIIQESKKVMEPETPLEVMCDELKKNRMLWEVLEFAAGAIMYIWAKWKIETDVYYTWTQPLSSYETRVLCFKYIGIILVVFGIVSIVYKLFCGSNKKSNDFTTEEVLKGSEKKKMHFCTNCGAKLKEEDKFCPACGKKIN